MMRLSAPQPSDLGSSAEEPMRSELTSIADLAIEDQRSSLVRSALAFAALRHDGQRRDSDGAAFIEHPIEVAQLLYEAGCSQVLVAAGLLHDVLEKSDTGIAELETAFGGEVTGLVRAVSENAAIAAYRERKHHLREQVRGAGHDAALVFAADKISKVREFADGVDRGHPTAPAGRTAIRLEQSQRERLEHYRHCLQMLQDIAPEHPLVRQLADELTRTSIVATTA